MAAFDPGDDAEEMPDIKWVDGFQRSEDAAWWSKGDHVGLGKDLVRSSLRALAPDLPTPSAGDLGLANNMVDGCIPIAFTGIEDKDSGFRLKAGADGTDFTTLEELAAVNGKLIGWLNELATKVSVVKALTDAGKIQKAESHLVDPSKLARIAKKPVKMTAEQDAAVVAGEALDERALADLIQAHTSLSHAIGGPQIDHATCFGDAAAPAQANRVQVRPFPLLISSCDAFAAPTCSSEPGPIPANPS